MSTPVLATKLFAPTRRKQLVARPRLVVKLDATLDVGHRLTVMSAPAGFGKTTLLSDWLAHLEDRETSTRVGWLSLDDGDNDLTRFLTHALAALRSAGLDVDPSLLESLRTAGASPLVTAVINDVCRAADQEPLSRWVLVLDDYHAVAATEVHGAVAFLLDHLPGQLHLVLATRADPPLPLARLRSRGQLTEVRAADLRFTPPEARDFLHQVMGLDLTVDHLTALEERTEGWIAGLQLAALSLRGIPGRGEITAFIEAFTGSNRFVVDYLADEVLARQPAATRDFLLRTAVLDRLTGPLCDAVTGRADGARTLEELDRANVFVVPLDHQRAWYRYHHLFADVLRARLLADSPDQANDLHQRASAWCASHGLTADAVRHALAAADFDRAAHLVEEAVPEMRRARQDSLLLTWIRSLPDSVVRRSPVLSIVSGWSLLMSGDLDAVESRLDDAETALDAGVSDPALAATWADTEDLRTAPATISIYRASLAQARGDVAGTVQNARNALALAGSQDHYVLGAGAGFLGLAAWAAGDIPEALSTFSRAVRSLHAGGNLVDELDATVVLADMWVAAGRPSRARRLYEQALHTAVHHGQPYPRATADLHVGLAELDRELDDLADADSHLETARVLGERSSITENRHRWFVATAQVCAARGQYDTAAALLDQAEALYRRGFYPEVRPIAAMRARLQVAAGDLEAAVAWVQGRGVSVSDVVEYLREYEHLTLARLLLAQHRTAGDADRDRGAARLSAVRDLLDRMHAAAADAGRAGSVVEILMLQALAHEADGDRPQALAVLGRSFADTPEPQSYARLYLDEGEPMRALLHHAAGVASTVRAENGAVLRDHARRLLGRASTSVDVDVAGAGAGAGAGAEGTEPHRLPVDTLSRRELEVLRLLDSELTGPEIARELYVTLNTLRTHTKRIFTKLDATTRAAAVRRAHERGLL